MSFDINDLMRIDENRKGYINILRLTDILDKPKLFSIFMRSLLAKVYQQMSEKVGSEQTEFILFIDEAHLIFNEASKTLLEQIETIIKLVSSKEIGIYFVTQNSMEILSGILAQQGLKIKHALKALTAKDRQSIKQATDNYPS
jgi:hypothetical protein